jgi:hypothetical protein
MSDLSQGSFAQIVLKVGESVRVTTSGSATVTSAYGAPDGTTTVTANSVPFGPYGVPAKLRVTAVAGACSYGPLAGVGGSLVTAPASLTAANAADYNGGTVSLAAGATLTIDGAAWASLPGGLVIQPGQSGSATIAFSGTAVKENAAGTSATSVTLAAGGTYVLTQSPSGASKFRLSGGASL